MVYITKVYRSFVFAASDAEIENVEYIEHFQTRPQYLSNLFPWKIESLDWGEWEVSLKKDCTSDPEFIAFTLLIVANVMASQDFFCIDVIAYDSVYASYEAGCIRVEIDEQTNKHCITLHRHLSSGEYEVKKYMDQDESRNPKLSS